MRTEQAFAIDEAVSEDERDLAASEADLAARVEATLAWSGLTIALWGPALALFLLSAQLMAFDGTLGAVGLLVRLLVLPLALLGVVPAWMAARRLIRLPFELLDT